MSKRFKVIISALRKNITNMVQLEGKLTSEQRRELCEALRNNVSLEMLVFYNANLGRNGFVDVCDSLIHHPKVRCLRVERTIISRLKDSIGRLMTANSNIDEVIIRYCDVNSYELDVFFQMITESQLTTFDFRQLHVNQKAVIKGAVQLLLANKLERLYLPINVLSYEAALWIGYALRNNTSLQRFELDDEGVAQQGAVPTLLENLRENSVLSILVLGTVASYEDVQILIHFLTFNDVFKSFSINNSLTTQQLSGAARIFNINSKLMFFGHQRQVYHLGDDINLSYQYERAISEASDRNVELNAAP